MQPELDLQFTPTAKQICMLCHFSSECGQCCKTCKEKCNAHQICGLKEPEENHIDRFSAWVSIIKSCNDFSNLKRFIPKNV